MREIKIKSFDGRELHTYIYDDVKNPLGILHIVHGSAEHALRYKKFCELLNQNGYIVIAVDTRGHGKTANIEKNELGYFADEKGWDIIIDDLHEINKYIKQNYENLKVIIFGHSMGSFMVRTYLVKYGNTVDGAILSGTGQVKTILAKTMLNIAKLRQKKLGAKGGDKFIWNQSYKGLNKKFNHKKATGVEWLSQSMENQKSFIEDPLTGFMFSSSAFKDMATGILFMQNKKNIKQMDRNLPILIASGTNDPVGDYSKGPKKYYKLLNKLDFKKVELKLYKDYRHEILFETNKEIVEQDIIEFLNSITK